MTISIIQQLVCSGVASDSFIVFEEVSCDLSIKDLGSEIYKEKYCNVLFSTIHENQPEPMFKLKLCYFVDGFSLSGFWNHALSDLTGIYYFFHCVARLYGGADIKDLKAPIFDRPSLDFAINSHASKEYKAIGSAKQNYDKVSYDKHYFVTDRWPDLDKLRYIPILFNLDPAEALKIEESQDEYVSMSDIINASLIEMLHNQLKASSPSAKDIALYTVVNLRNNFNFPEHIIGNLVERASVLLDRSKVESIGIPYIARMSRRAVDTYDKSNFFELNDWIAHWALAGETLYPHWAIGPEKVCTTNWTTYNFNKLKLGDSKVIGITGNIANISPFTSNIIFYTKGEKRIYAFSVFIESNYLSQLQNSLAKMSHLSAIRLDTGENL